METKLVGDEIVEVLWREFFGRLEFGLVNGLFAFSVEDRVISVTPSEVRELVDKIKDFIEI